MTLRKEAPGRRLALVPALALVSLGIWLGLGGCAQAPYEASPIYSGIAVEHVWDTTLEVVQRDYPIAKVDRGRWTFESRWRESLAPMRFQGVRERVFGRVLPEEEGHRVELRVLRQRNEAMEHPLDSNKAKWAREEWDPQAARVLLQKIEAILRPYLRERREA
jgi:hypothetical protein